MRLKATSQIDRDIGQRLRAYRLAAGMSQSAVGDHLGVSFQQVQKYEKGINRLSGASLAAVTELLHVKPEQLLGINGAGPSQDEFAALSDRHINKIGAVVRCVGIRCDAISSISRVPGQAARSIA